MTWTEEGGIAVRRRPSSSSSADVPANLRALWAPARVNAYYSREVEGMVGEQPEDQADRSTENMEDRDWRRGKEEPTGTRAKIIAAKDMRKKNDEEEEESGRSSTSIPVDRRVPPRFSRAALLLSVVSIACFSASLSLFLLWHHHLGSDASGSPPGLPDRAGVYGSLSLLAAAGGAFCLAERRQCRDERRYQRYLQVRKREVEDREGREGREEKADKCVQAGNGDVGERQPR